MKAKNRGTAFTDSVMKASAPGSVPRDGSVCSADNGRAVSVAFRNALHEFPEHLPGPDFIFAVEHMLAAFDFFVAAVRIDILQFSGIAEIINSENR